MSNVPPVHREAGRALDAEIAEKVMDDQKLVPPVDVGRGRMMHWKSRGELMGEPPCYSTDIAAAWRILDVLEHGLPPRYSTVTRRSYNSPAKYVDGGWSCEFRDISAPWEMVYVEAPTATLAICLAALRAVGVTFDEEDSEC